MRWLKGTRDQRSARPRPSGRHWFSTSALEEALRLGGCPVCVAVSFSERRSLHSFLYEGMMSPMVRKNFLEGSGFCATHFFMAAQIESECWPAGGIGIAILFEDLIREAMAKVAQSQPRDGRRNKPVNFDPGSGCLSCQENRRKERSLIEVLEELADGDEFTQPLKSGRLCLRHTQLALQCWAEPAKRDWLATALAERAAELSTDLREFIRKHDYQFKHEPKGREQDVVRRSAEFIFGSRYAQKRVLP